MKSREVSVRPWTCVKEKDTAHLSQGKCAASGVEDYSYVTRKDTEAWR